MEIENCELLKLYKKLLDDQVLNKDYIYNINILEDKESIKDKSLEYFLQVLQEMMKLAEQHDIIPTFILNNYNLVLVPLNKVKNKELHSNLKKLTNKISTNKVVIGEKMERVCWGKLE